MKKRDDLYLREMEERAIRIGSHLSKISREKFLTSKLHRSAVVRELEVIGEASKKISEETKSKYPSIPWKKIMGMRNRLTHEYFDVDYSIVWEVAQNEIPTLKRWLSAAILAESPAVHPWRQCPYGYYHVVTHERRVHVSERNPDGSTSVREHCRRNPSGKDQLYPDEISDITEKMNGANDLGMTPGRLPFDPRVKKIDPNQFDHYFQIWAKYWSDLLDPNHPLDPNILKALMSSESSFDPNVKDTKLRGKNKGYARGLMQITDETRKVLADEKGELKDHYLTLSPKDVKKPSIAVCAAARWLFHKRDLASKRLGREATWDEAVAFYKAYLKNGKPSFKHRGMKNFEEKLRQLRSSK